MSKAKPSKAKGPKPMTISAYAMAIGADRRTITRRLLASGVEPAGKRGLYDLYAVSDLAKVTQEIDQPEPEREHRRRASPEQITCAFESGFNGSIDAMGESMPEAVSEALSQAGLTATQPQADRIALSLWQFLVRAIESALNEEYFDLCGHSLAEDSLASEIGESPDAIKLAWERLHSPE